MLRFLYGPTLLSIHDYWKNHSLNLWTCIGKAMSLIFNMLSMLIKAFLPRSKHLLVSRLQWLQQGFWSPRKKSVTTFHFFLFYLPGNNGTGCHDFSLLNVEFQVSFFTLVFQPHQRFFSSSPLSATRVVSSAYLRLLLFLPAILIPVCDSFILLFHVMYYAYKLNK